MCFIAQAQQKRPLRAGRLAVAGDRNFRGLSQQRRIFPYPNTLAQNRTAALT
jgi:hypothetical protein